MRTVAPPALSPLEAPRLPRGRANLVLAGFMGTGKTTAGRLAAAELGLPFLDLDDAIASRANATVAALISTEGEPAFRARERAAVADAARLSGTVIATGGGAPLDREGFARLAATGAIVVLTAAADVLVRRLGDGAGRPLLAGDPKARIRDLLAARAEAYAALGPALDTSGRDAPDVAREIASRYRAAWPPGPVRLEVVSADGTTRVIVGDGVLAACAEDLRAALEGSSRAAIVADPVASTYAAAAAAALREAGIEPVGPILVPSGEAAKRVETLAALWDRFRAERLDPSCAVVAIGGGATLDVAGFAAATYARGIPLVNVPTTVLAMADAALGGKVAIDHAGAKNLVGAFHHARAVVADPTTCATLTPAARRQGLAEIVKAAVLASPLVLELIADAPLAWSVEQALRIKAAYVAADPRDRGPRRALNLGHTFAHAIESASEHAVAHGDAVSMGLVAAARLGAAVGSCDGALADRLARTLARLGLPTVAPALEEGRLLDALAADKKRAGGAVRFVVPATGGAALLSGVDPREALRMLAA